MRESRKADAIKSTFRAVFKLVIKSQWVTTRLKDYYRGLGSEFEEESRSEDKFTNTILEIGKRPLDFFPFYGLTQK